MKSSALRPLLLALLASSCSSSPAKTDGQTLDQRPADQRLDSASREAGAREAGAREARAPDRTVADAGKPPCQEVPCAVVKTVSSPGALQAELNAVTWTGVGPYTTKCLPVSADLEVVGGAVTVDGTTLQVPSTCTAAGPCRQQVLFSKGKLPAGVTCTQEDTETWTSLCRTLSFAPGRYRFRGELQDWHPSKWNFMPVIVVLPSCALPCASGELRCEPNQTCWPGFDIYCRLCLAKDKQTCACLTSTGAKPDQTACQFFVSGDVMCSGICKNGFCESTWHGAGCP